MSDFGAFDPDLIEFHHVSDTDLDALIVEVYKIGGGTLGRAYAGYWGYRISRRDQEQHEVLTQGTDLRTGTAATHAEVALQLVRSTLLED